MNNTISQISVGIDVAKDFLDIHLHPLEKNFRVNNDTTGLKKLCSIIADYQVTQIACEATGGYEYLSNKLLTEHGYSVWIVEPKRMRAFINSEGIKVKTDKIDARMIALFASQKRRNFKSVPLSPDEELLSSLSCRRNNLVEMLNAEENRFQHPRQVLVKKEIKQHITFLKKQIQDVELLIKHIIKKNSELDAKNHILQSIPGVGQITALTLLTEIPELGKISDKQAASLLGVAPVIKQSGLSKGVAIIKGGRAYARHIFYMATLVAIKHNPKIKEFYERLRSAGKKCKVALIACMRKLICIINHMMTENIVWSV